MLRVILNRLKAKAEELLAEDQAGFRPGRSTGEHRETPTTTARAVPQLRRLQEGV